RSSCRPERLISRSKTSIVASAAVQPSRTRLRISFSPGPATADQWRVYDRGGLLDLDRHRRKPAALELALGVGEVAGGAVRAHPHAVDGLAVDLRRLDSCAEAEQGDPRLQFLGLGTGLER